MQNSRPHPLDDDLDSPAPPSHHSANGQGTLHPAQPLLRLSVFALIASFVVAFGAAIALGIAAPNSAMETMSSRINRAAAVAMLLSCCGILLAYRLPHLRRMHFPAGLTFISTHVALLFLWIAASGMLIPIFGPSVMVLTTSLVVLSLCLILGLTVWKYWIEPSLRSHDSARHARIGSPYRSVDTRSERQFAMAISEGASAASEYRVLLQKEQLVFSAAHFITFAGDICECLHGHNYGVKAEVTGPLDENQYVIDFIAFRDALAEIVRRLDHHVLLPTTHPLIRVHEGETEVTTTFAEKRWIFPREDCMLLPITNTTAEQIAWWMAGELRSAMKPKVGDRIHALEIAIDENHGQWGICKIDW